MDLNMTTTSSVTTNTNVSFPSSSTTSYISINPMTAMCDVIAARVMALLGLMNNASEDMQASTNAELQAQSMSNAVNAKLVDCQNSDDPATQTETLDQTTCDYINNAYNSDPSFKSTLDGAGVACPIDTDTQLNEGQLTGIKGALDVQATTYADSSSQTQMTIQQVAQSFSVSITEISQLMSKNNQIMQQIVSNLK